MNDELALAALFLGAASLIIIALIFVHARHDPKPLVRVRLDDPKTHRREPKPLDGAWVHILGMTALAIEIYLLARTF